MSAVVGWCAMVVMGIVAVMFAGACWFFRSCRGNKAFRTEYRVTTDGIEFRVEWLRPARFWRRAAWLPVYRLSVMFPEHPIEAKFATEAEANEAITHIRKVNAAKERGWQEAIDWHNDYTRYKAQNKKVVCMQCAQRMHDKKAAYRLIYDETLNDLVMMCPRCGRRHAKIARREAQK
jgi:hypothetical protein